MIFGVLRFLSLKSYIAFRSVKRLIVLDIAYPSNFQEGVSNYTVLKNVSGHDLVCRPKPGIRVLLCDNV